MNIAPISNYNNQTSFGMAFKKNPPKEVTKLFEETISSMRPKERESFVDQVSQIIQRAKSCPVEIEHTLVTDYSPHYGAKVGNNTYTYNPQSSTNRADSILSTMSRAVSAAENQHDINSNMSRLSKIFNA